ncbi:MAG TPA: aldo/keto reductase [Steroidobacteraceae bacterium]|nr:aldo/keto reductase [Steroidobacteraceae bacterium]
MLATERRRIPKADLPLSVLGLGTAPLGGMYAAVPLPEGEATVAKAIDLGLRYFDTAPMYGLGKAEHVLGHSLLKYAEADPRFEYVLSTKVGRLLVTDRPGRPPRQAAPKNDLDSGWHGALRFHESFDYAYDAVMRSFDDSQHRLGMPKIDILYVHDIGRTTHGVNHDRHWNALTSGGGFRALNELRAAGLIKAVGVGVNEWEIVREVLDHVDLDCCLLAGRYSLLEQTALTPLLALCERRRIGVIIGGAFNSGILVAHVGGHRKFNYGDAPNDVVEKVGRLRKVCDSFGVEMPAAALQFPLAHPAVVSVIVGSRSAAEIHQAVRWLEQPLADDLWGELKRQGLLEAEAPVPQSSARPG